MKKLFLVFAAAALYCTAAHAVTIAFWSFNTGGVSVDEGAGTLVQATGAGAESWPAGTPYTTSISNYVAGSALSRASASWGTGSQSTRFYEMRVNASALSALSLRFDASRSGTGPTRVDLYYSTDGGSSYALFSSLTQPSAWTVFSFAGLSSISGLNNNSDVRFRLCPMSASGSAGTIRFDNMLVEALPEPGLLVGLLGCAVLLLPRVR